MAGRWRLVSPRTKSLLAAVTCLGTMYGAARYAAHRIQRNERDRTFARAESVTTAFDTTRQRLVIETRVVAARATTADTSTERSSARVRRQVRQLPPPARAIPEVVALADSAVQLAIDSDSVRAVLRQSIRLTETIQRTDSAAMQSMRVTITKHADRVRVLEQRPPWWKVALIGIGAAAAGAVIALVAGAS